MGECQVEFMVNVCSNLPSSARDRRVRVHLIRPRTLRSDTLVETPPAMVSGDGIARWDQQLMLPVTMIDDAVSLGYKPKIVKVLNITARAQPSAACTAAACTAAALL